MTPLNPSKRVKTAKKVCREAERAPWVTILTVFINFQGDVLYFHEKENKFLIAWYIIFELYGSGIKNSSFYKDKTGQNQPRDTRFWQFLPILRGLEGSYQNMLLK